MKWMKNGHFSYLVDSTGLVYEAYSYDTMLFSAINELCLVNSTKYSNTTSRHQNKLARMLPDVHPVGPYIEVSEVPQGTSSGHALYRFYTSFNERK